MSEEVPLPVFFDHIPGILKVLAINDTELLVVSAWTGPTMALTKYNTTNGEWSEVIKRGLFAPLLPHESLD